MNGSENAVGFVSTGCDVGLSRGVGRLREGEAAAVGRVVCIKLVVFIT
jgi:hypothetical protein